MWKANLISLRLPWVSYVSIKLISRAKVRTFRLFIYLFFISYTIRIY